MRTVLICPLLVVLCEIVLAQTKEDPYMVLGVHREASQEEIRRAFRKMSLEVHPDKNPNNPEAAHLFARLADAYEILSDPDKRALHDDLGGESYQTRPPNFDSTKGFYHESSLITTLDESNFNRLVLCEGVPQSECSPWMVELYATWCVHCRNMIDNWKRAASQMDGTETDLGYVRFGGINCEAHRNLCQSLEVNSYPTIRFYARSKDGHLHMEQFPSSPDRSAEKLIEFATLGARLAGESNLVTLDAEIFPVAVTGVESVGPWVVIFEQRGQMCKSCDSTKASMRRMSANLKGLANFGVVDCGQYSELCLEQFASAPFPKIKMYPYKGAKGTGEILFDAAVVDPMAALPVAERVIRMCIGSLESETGLMRPPLTENKDDPPPPPPPPPQPAYEHPKPQLDRGGGHQPAGIRAGNPTVMIGG